MPNNITLAELTSAQNEFFANATSKINSLEANTAAAIEALNELANREYGFAHEAIVTKSIDAVYDSIIEENPELAELSAVGFTALLNDGNTIPTQGNIMFINGTQEETDYAFSGENSEDGTEFVSVWYFENDGALTVNSIGAEILNIIIKQKITIPVFSTDFFDFAKSVEYSSLPVKPVAVKKQKCTQGGNISDMNISATCAEYENHCSAFEGYEQLRNGTNFKVVKFPFLTTIAQAAPGSYSFLNGCTNLEKIEFPLLETVGGATSRTTASFRSVPNITLPTTVKTIGNYVFDNNRSISLLCKDATSISDNWCSSAPSEAFSICADWGASINLVTAASNWNEEQWYDFFVRKLRRYPPFYESGEIDLENPPPHITVTQPVMSFIATHGVTGVEPEYEGDLISEYLPKIGWWVTAS